MKNKIIESYSKVFSATSDIRVFFAPGRVNLIGEHIDYNGGHVLPCALSIGTYIAVTLREDNKIALYSDNFKKEDKLAYHLSDSYRPQGKWTDYVLGMLQVLSDEGYTLDCGFNMYCYGNIPNGAGLSSSSSLELATITFLDTMYHFNLTDEQKVKMSRKVENDFVGVSCGIMDQFIIGYGKENHALLLNTHNLEYKHVPIHLGEYALVIANTNKKRGLADSKYNERFSECQYILKKVSETFNVEQLCDLKVEQLDKVKSMLDDETLTKRLNHVVSENARVLNAFDALKSGDLKAFGLLMNASHTSLRDDYEVTGIELDTLVSLSQKAEGVLGSRMTGAGFGGCIVTLIKQECIEAYKESVSREYIDKIGYLPTFYEVCIGSGACELL